MTKLFKALGAALLAVGLVVAGVASPASATGVLNVSVTSGSSTIGTTGTNGVPISVSFRTTTAGADNFTIEVPSAWSAANIGTLCAGLVINVENGNSPTTCAAAVQGSSSLLVTITKSTTAWANNLGITVEFPAGSLNVATGRVFTVRSYTGSTAVDVGTGTLSSGSNSVTTFTVANATLVDGSSNAITSLPVSTAVPAFTATASGFSGGATVSSAGVIFSTNGFTEYFAVSNPVNSMASPPPSPISWSPGTCGVTAVSIGGVAQTGSSGVTCQKQTWQGMSATAYAVRVYFSSATASDISISIADGVFTSGSAATYNFRLALSGLNLTGQQAIPVTVGGSAPQSSSSATAALTISASTGSTVAGSAVAIQASGLQSTAAYTVTVESTPQVIGSGNAVSGAVNSSVTLPSGLEAGWHTLTFSSTAADGSPVLSKAYFKVSASGTLLSTSTTIPAELANTGIDSTNGIMFLLGGLSLALIGAEMIMIARRKRSN